MAADAVPTRQEDAAVKMCTQTSLTSAIKHFQALAEPWPNQDLQEGGLYAYCTPRSARLACLVVRRRRRSVVSLSGQGRLITSQQLSCSCQTPLTALRLRYLGSVESFGHTRKNSAESK